MSITEFLILSIVIGLIAYTFLAAMIINGWQRCQFCTGFWWCCVFTVVYGFLFAFSYPLIALPFAGAAVCHFINK